MAISSPETLLSLLDQVFEPLADDADEAWDRLVPIYQSLLQKWLRAAGLQPADRDDLTQRVLEVLVRRLPEFEHNGRPGAFRAWLCGITVNRARGFWRAGSIRAEAVAGSSILQRIEEPHD